MGDGPPPPAAVLPITQRDVESDSDSLSGVSLKHVHTSDNDDNFCDDPQAGLGLGEGGVGARGPRPAALVIARSGSLQFVFACALLQNAGMSVMVPSMALHLESLAASPALLGYVAAMAPFVSVISPTAIGFLVEVRNERRINLAPFATHTPAHPHPP